MKAPSESEAPGLPGLRTWRQVYWVVLASFVLWTALLVGLAALYP